MKKGIFLLVIAILIITSNSYSGVKDSAAKYEGTKYIGDIFKDYDYLPEPIKKKLSLRLTNSFHVVPMNSGLIYEAGFTMYLNIPIWNDGLFWVRTTSGLYFKSAASKNPLYSFGLNVNFRFDSPFYVGINEGLFWGSWEGSKFDYETDKFIETIEDGGGIEIELVFGYDFNFDDWIITPELKFNSNLILDHTFFNTNSIKSPIQLGLNIGRDF